MPRITLPEREGTNLEKALSKAPTLKSLYDELYHFLWNDRLLSKEIKEKIRLYLAHINGCMTCMSLSYIENEELNTQIAEAIRNNDFSHFSMLEQKLFSFIEQYRLSPRSITDQDVEELRHHFTDDQLIHILGLINLFDGFHKIIVSLDLYDFCSRS
jgi:alkylhydroperoxidase family enzyme